MRLTTLTAIIVPIAMVLTCIGVSSAMAWNHKEKMAELGYVEVAYPGSYRTHWEPADFCKGHRHCCVCGGTTGQDKEGRSK